MICGRRRIHFLIQRQSIQVENATRKGTPQPPQPPIFIRHTPQTSLPVFLSLKANIKKQDKIKKRKTLKRCRSCSFLRHHQHRISFLTSQKCPMVIIFITLETIVRGLMPIHKMGERKMKTLARIFHEKTIKLNK